MMAGKKLELDETGRAVAENITRIRTARGLNYTELSKNLMRLHRERGYVAMQPHQIFGQFGVVQSSGVRMRVMFSATARPVSSSSSFLPAITQFCLQKMKLHKK
ncbi:hypothetical protein MAHJHV63_54350 [Mycobacterium avium subsp. hominissuis]